MTKEEELSLARDIMYGPTPKPEDSMPTVEAAIEEISHRRHCWFNWTTGIEALKALKDE